MKIRATITAVEDVGDALRVKAQGYADTDAEWQPTRVIEMSVPNGHNMRRALYVGRKLNVTVRPA